MYRRGIFIVGCQFQQILCHNLSSTIGAQGRTLTMPSNCTMIKNEFRRNYCDNSSTDPYMRKQYVDKVAEEKINEILKDPQMEKLYKIIELELEILRQSNERVPNVLLPRHWLELIQLPSRLKRKKFLDFVWTVERKKEHKLQKQQEKKEERDQLLPGSLTSLGKNSIFMRIYESTMNHMYNGRLMNRMLYGQPLVLDCSYEEHMDLRARRNCAHQLQLSFACNRFHKDPFDLHFCNINLKGEIMYHLGNYIPTMHDKDFPITLHTESYLDLFEKDKLIYLTPHCTNVMEDFDRSAVYIVGAFVDKGSYLPLSLAKAKKQGLKMAKFPIDKYLKWGTSSTKNLTVNQVVSILLDLRHTGSWDEAFKHVPVRKLFEHRSRKLEKKIEAIQQRDAEQSESSIETDYQTEGDALNKNFTMKSRSILRKSNKN